MWSLFTIYHLRSPDTTSFHRVNLVLREMYHWTNSIASFKSLTILDQWKTFFLPVWIHLKNPNDQLYKKKDKENTKYWRFWHASAKYSKNLSKQFNIFKDFSYVFHDSVFPLLPNLCLLVTGFGSVTSCCEPTDDRGVAICSVFK